MKNIFKICALVCLAALSAFGQGTQRISRVQTVQGQALSGANIWLCAANATVNFSATPPCLGVSIYSNVAMTQPIVQPLLTDSYGNYSYYAIAGTYTEVVTGPTITGYQTTVVLPCVPNTPSGNGCGGTGGAGNPAGVDTNTQINKGGVFGAIPNFGVDSSTSPTNFFVPFSETLAGPRPRRDVTSPIYAGGADPTATNDSTAAVQAAINAACAAGGLGDVFFPPGAYKIAVSTTSAPQLSIPKSCSALHFVGGNGSIAPDKAQFETPPQTVLYSPNCSGAGTGPMFLLENGTLAGATQGGTGSTFSNLGIVGCNQGVWAYGVANVTFNNIAFGNTNSFGADPYSLKITNSFFVYINGGTINNYNTTVPGVLLSAETPLGTEPSEVQIVNFRNTIFNGAVLLDQRVSTPNQSGAILFDGVQAEIGGSSVPFFTTQCEASCNAFGPLNISYSGVSDNNSGTPLIQLRGFARYNDITVIDSNGSATGSPAINADNVLLDCMVIGGAFSSRTVVTPTGTSQSGCVQQNINGFDFTSNASSFPSGAMWGTSFLSQGGFFGGNQGPAIRMAVQGDTQSRLALDPNAGLVYGPGGTSGQWDAQLNRSGAGALGLSLTGTPNTFPANPQFTFNTVGLGIFQTSPLYPLDVKGTAEVLGGINVYTDTGAANAYVVSTGHTVASVAVGQFVTFQAVHANTGTSTLVVDALSSAPIKKIGGSALSVNLAAGDIQAGQIVTVAWDGTDYEIQSTLGNATSGGGSGTVGNCVLAPAPAYYSGSGTTTTCLNLPAFMQYLYAADSGAVNAYVVAPTTAATLVTGTTINFTTANANTGASTINVSSLGVKALTKYGTVPLVVGDILANTYYVAQYDGTRWQLLNPSSPNCINCVFLNAANTFGVGGTIDLSASTATNAFKFPIQSAGVTSANGAAVFDSIFQNVHLGANSGDNLIPLIPTSVSITDADCTQYHNVSSHITLNDAAGGGCTLLNANNVFGTSVRLNLSAATNANALVLPNQVGAAPTVAGATGFDTTALQPVVSDGVIVCPYSKEQVNAQSGAGYTVLTTDCGKLVSVSNASAQTLTLPASPPSKGWFVDIENTGTSTWTITPNGNNLDNVAGSTTIATNQGMRIASNGSGYFSMRGVGGGGGGSANINPSAQFSVPYYANAGTANVLSGQQAPSSPNGVPQFEVSIPSGGNPTAPTFAPAGVVPRLVSGASDTILATDRAGEVIYSDASAVSVTFPQAGTTGFASNFVVLLDYTGNNILTITPATSTINGAATLTMGQNNYCFIYSDNTNYYANCTNGQSSNPIVADTGSANAYVVAYPLIQSLETGSTVFFTVSHANTTASTLTVNGLASKSLTKNGAATLIANDLVTTTVYWAIYDGTQWELVNPSNGDLTTFTAHKFLGNGTASTAVAAPTTIGSSDTSPMWYAADSGAANAYVVAPSPALTALTVGSAVFFTTANANSGASTINVSGLGVKALDKLNVSALVSGDILATAVYEAVYDGTEWILLNPSNVANSGTVNNCVTSHSAGWFSSNGTTLSCTSESALSQYLYAADSGAANAYVITLAPALGSLVTGEQAFFTTANANTTASTINVNGLGVKNITKNGATALVANDILASTVYEIAWDGTEWQLINPSSVSALVAANVVTQAANAANGNIASYTGANKVAVPLALTFSSQTDGATVTWAIGNVPLANTSLTFTVHGGSRTLNITNPVDGGSYVILLKQDATGGEGLVLGTGCTWKVINGGGGAITLSTGAAAVDVLAFTYQGATGNCYANLGKNYN